jgi:hypothetical protein
MSYRALAAVAALAVAVPAAAQTYIVRRVAPHAGATVHLSGEVIAGQTIRAWWATLLSADCSPSGTMTTSVIEAPRRGQVAISDAPFPPDYVAPNPRVRCDRQPQPGKQAFYTAPAGFHGHDRFVLQNARSDGVIRRIVVDVKVA